MVAYRLDPAAFRAELLNADWMVDAMRERAERGREFVQSAAPVDTGRFRSAVSVDARKRGGVHHDRAEAVLSSDDPAALSIEFGHAAPDGAHVEGAYTYTQAMDAMR